MSSLRALLLGVGLIVVPLGCDSKSFIDPGEMGRYQHEPLASPILNTLDPAIETKSDEFAGATDPLPSDLSDTTTDYRISRDDQLSIAISDLQGPGQETVKVTRVTESGNISLPFVGAVHAEGLTEIELEQAIIEAYRNANLIQNAQVSVSVVEPRGRAFSILGAVVQPGEYAIAESDFRIINALVLARDVTSPLVEYAYVIRRSEQPHVGTGPATTRPVGGRPASAPASGPASEDLAPHSQATPIDHNVVHLAADVAAADAPPAAPASAPDTAPATAPAVDAPAIVPTGPGTTTGGNATTKPFEFNEPTMPGAPRIIRIPLQALRSGELRYNIVVRPKDVIFVQPLQTGVYYMGGHVQRPGVYNLTGQHITLKNAVVSAGMLDAVAIPQRTDVIRRIRPDHEVFVRIDLDKIFAGQQPDFFLRPDDQVVVGTNALAPFIAAVRGAFRITYGFGFLYDRNFFNPRNGNGSGGF